MMKKTLKTIIATTVSMLLLGATTVLSAGAVSIDVEDVTLNQVTNDKIPVKVLVSGNTTGLSMFSFVVNYDGRLDVSNDDVYFNSRTQMAAVATVQSSTAKVAVAGARTGVYTAGNFELFTIEFTLPEDAESGDVYPISFQNFSTLASFSFGSVANPISASNLGSSSGFIKIQ